MALILKRLGVALTRRPRSVRGARLYVAAFGAGALMLMTFIAIISGEGLNESVPIFFFEAAFVVALIASPRIPRVGWLIAVVIFVHLSVLLYWLAFLFAVPVQSGSAAQSLGARGLTVLLMLPLVAQMALLIWRLGSSAEQSADSLSSKATANQ